MNNREKYKNLANNKFFCVASWTHNYLLSTGKIIPCRFFKTVYRNPNRTRH